MQTRREFVVRSLAVAGTLPIAGCASGNMGDYERVAALTRTALSADPDLRQIVRFATLAPNGHNTQPWRFAVTADGCTISPDFTRRTPIVDPDDHHLFVSLGTAAETLLIAAAAHGRPGELVIADGPRPEIAVNLSTGERREDPLYRAIPARQSTRSRYDGRAVPPSELHLLVKAAMVDGVSVKIMTRKHDVETVLAAIIEGNTRQMDNPEFIAELKRWIRFNPADALATRDGLFSACSGNRTSPSWIGNALFDRFFKKDDENAKYARHLRSSAGVAVFIGDKADRQHWIKVGRSFQRFALQATALGIRHAHVNQPVEAPEVRAPFAKWLGIGAERPDLVVRFGYAPPLPMSLRRPVDAVLAT